MEKVRICEIVFLECEAIIRTPGIWQSAMMTMTSTNSKMEWDDNEMMRALTKQSFDIALVVDLGFVSSPMLFGVY